MRWTRFGLSLTAVGAVSASAALFPACTPAETTGPLDAALPPIPEGDSGPPCVSADGAAGISFAGAAGKPCVAPTGQLPNPACDDGDETQCASTPGCSIKEPQCGSTSTCEPLTDNSASPVKTFRMRRLIIAAPSTLANSTIQNAVLNLGVDMNEPQCGETQTGAFSWLLSFDTTTQIVTTGRRSPVRHSGHRATPAARRRAIRSTRATAS